MSLTSNAPVGGSSGGGRALASNILAALCLVFALLCPLGMLVNAVLVYASVGFQYPAVFLYNAYDYLLAPMSLLALLFGALARLLARPMERPPAWLSLTRIGMRVCLVTLAAIVIFWVVLIVALSTTP